MRLVFLALKTPSHKLIHINRIIDRAQLRLHKVLQSPKGSIILKSEANKFNGNLELSMGSLLWHARCECLKKVLQADQRFKK